MWTRLIPVTVGIIALTGCYDFTGDRERLGFSTDATLDGHHAWTPGTPLADGARPHLAVTEILATDQEPEGPVTFDSTRGIELTRDDDGVILAGKGRGWIGAAADGVRDEFRFRFKPADHGGFVDPLAMLLGRDATLDHIAVVAGTHTTVGYALYDRKDNALGYVPDQLEITADDGVSIDVDETLRIEAKVPGAKRLDVGWPGADATTLEIDVVHPDAIDRIEIITHHLEGACGLQALLFAGDQPVRSADGFTWTHDDTTGPLVECDADVEVRWGDLVAST